MAAFAAPVTVLKVGLGFLPVGLFLAGLMALDSFKLVRLRLILWMLAWGAAAAGAGYLANRGLLGAGLLEAATLRRFAAPLLEELLKGLPLLLLMRSGKSGFLVDAAIYGFAVGTGFALVENVYYLMALPDAGVALWLVRGFGTAVMHGGTTAILAMATQAIVDRRGAWSWVAPLPGFALALAVHSAFNAFLLPPMLSAAAVLLVLPPLTILAFARGEAYLRAWLGHGFNLHADLMEAIRLGGISETPTGRYLLVLREHFSGEVVADMLCYLRLCTELSLRAKGMLILREHGLEPPWDEELAEKLAEFRYLKKSIGPTGELALSPILELKAQDLWQLENLHRP
jgi:RsiW-degrading membrane proteinase PrsW (M82 family)